MKTVIMFLIVIFLSPLLNAKVLTSDKINDLFKSKGHFIRFIGDEKYQLIDVEPMTKLIKKVMVESKFIESKILDCDRVSILLFAEIIKYQYIKNNRLPLAFGEAVIQSRKEKHTLNFFISNDNLIYFFDPYTFETYPYSDKIKLLLVRM